MTLALAATLASLAAGAVPAAAPAPPGVGALLAQVDAAWAQRDDPRRFEESRAALDRATVAAPGDYEVLWRRARLLSWLSDDQRLEPRDRSRYGKAGWDIGERAVRAAPDRWEGQLFSALCMGNYALGVGVFTALRQGIEGKFKERLSRAEAIRPDALSGAIPVAWGRFWYALPWPKYSASKSEESFRKALRMNPANVRARVYLAELYMKEGRRDAARTLLEDAAGATPGAYDAPEERRMQARARELLAAAK